MPDLLALEQHLTHAVYGDVEDGADVGSRINTAMRGDVVAEERSLVAHLTGGQGVAGSNPAGPTD